MFLTLNEYVNYLDLYENNISPLRFKDSDLEDIIVFVDELLYSTSKIDITEKIAGQHLTVNIKNNFITVNTKDSILHGTGDRNARQTRYGSELTRPLMQYLQSNPLPDQTWAFEIVNPKFNHDYIKYDHQDIIFIEYTGKLSNAVAADLRNMTHVKLLTRSDIKVSINKNADYLKFKHEWENILKPKYTRLDKRNKSKYYYSAINQLKFKIGDLLEKILVSAVDKKSPIEGIVANTKQPLKLQTNTFLSVQRIQMSMYSVFKISKDEIPYVLDNPTESFSSLQTKHDLKLTSIYKGDLKNSLYDMLVNYLTNNKKLHSIDTSKYRVWLTPTESDTLLQKLNKYNVKDIYLELYNKITK
jgi:hypothetical protein